MDVEHIGTGGCGSNILIKHKLSKDGRKVYIELRSHFQNDSYKQNVTTTSNKSIGYASCCGERRTLTLDTYYTIMPKNFNLLEQAGVDHTLTEEQKVIKFEAGLQEEKSISYSINAKSGWDRLSVLDKTFDAYYLP